MNSQHATNLVIRVNEQKTLLMRRRRLEAALLALLEGERRDEEFKIEWISISLAYFHGLPRRIGKELKGMSIFADAEGNFSVVLKGKTYWFPHWDYRLGPAPASDSIVPSNSIE